MTATNDYLPFATGTGANVISQAAYATLTAQQTGFQSGLAPSSQLNKVWRQASVVSSAMAQFICDKLGVNVQDDGSVSNFEALFESALGTVLVTSTPPLYVGSDTSTVNSQITATLAPAMAGYVNEAVYAVKTNTTPSGAVQASFNGLPNAQIVKSGGIALSGNEWQVGDVIILTYNGSQLVLANNNSVSSTITLNVPSQYPTVNAALVACSQLLVSTNSYINIQVAAGNYNLTSSTGPIYISHANGQRINIIGSALSGAFPTATQINGKTNAQVLTLLQGVFGTVFNVVGTDAVQVRSIFRSIQNCLFVGDGSTSGGHYGLYVGNWATEIGAGWVSVQNCWFHNFGLAGVRLEQSAFVQGNNLGSTYSGVTGFWVVHVSCLEVNFGNLLSMYGGSGCILTNNGLIAIPNATGTMDISYNTGSGVSATSFGQFSAGNATGLRIQNNGAWGIQMAAFSNAGVGSSATFSGNGSGDCYAYIDSFINTSGASVGTCSPTKGTTGNYGSTIF